MKGQKPERIEARFKLWLATGTARSAFGDGKCRLLKAIDGEGSLRKAAALLGMSYRKAWGDLRNAENALGVLLVERKRGGRSGGEMKLTADGREWIRAYSAMREEADKAIRAACGKHMAGLFR